MNVRTYLLYKNRPERNKRELLRCVNSQNLTYGVILHCSGSCSLGFPHTRGALLLDKKCILADVSVLTQCRLRLRL
jgi:hypothetical protein